MMWNWVLAVVAVAMLLVLLPCFVYVCVKVGTVAVLRGCQFFREQHTEERDSDGT